MAFTNTKFEEEPISELQHNNVFRSNYHKKHHFDYKNDVPIASLGPNDPLQMNGIFPSVKYESRTGSKALKLGIPDWITFDNQVLCFHAECLDVERIGKKDKFKIFYYLEDDTIQLVQCNHNEDKRFRSTLIKRMKIPKPGKESGEYYLLDDLNIGQIVTFYGSNYGITNCDNFTRDYLVSLGLQVPENEISFTSEDHQLDSLNKKKANVSSEDKKLHPLKQFLENDGNILQFYCIWKEPDDILVKHSDIQRTPNTKHMTLRYFLADDTVEICEITPPRANKSRSTTDQRPRSTVFVRRGKLPKKRVIEPLPVSKTETRMTSKSSEVYYNDGDFQIGNTVDVWGKKFLIYDCDAFTREFLRLKYGVEDVQSISSEVEVFDKHAQETSTANRSNEISPKVDFVKFMTRDRTTNESHILRFLGRLVAGETLEKSTTSQNIDENRRFIISYHLIDDTISVFEKTQRNSGNLGGKFIDRNRIYMENDKRFRKDYLKASDFYVGAKLCLNGHWFLLLDCDEYAKKYMEQHSDEFHFANGCDVLRKLKRAIGTDGQSFKKSFCDTDTENTGTLDCDALHKIVREHTGKNVFNEHEIMTLVRTYSSQSQLTDTTVSISEQHQPIKEELSQLFMFQNELRRQQFHEFDGLMNYLKSQDATGTCQMTEEKLLRACQAYPLPVKKHLILAALLSLKRTEEGCIDYAEFVKKINWRLNRLTNAYKQQQSAKDEHKTRTSVVNYKKLIHDMEELSL